MLLIFIYGICRRYTPPECKNGGNNVSIKFDVFSLGVIILDIVAGQNGYSRRSDMRHQVFIELVRKILSIELRFVFFHYALGVAPSDLIYK